MKALTLNLPLSRQPLSLLVDCFVSISFGVTYPKYYYLTLATMRFNSVFFYLCVICTCHTLWISLRTGCLMGVYVCFFVCVCHSTRVSWVSPPIFSPVVCSVCEPETVDCACSTSKLLKNNVSRCIGHVFLFHLLFIRSPSLLLFLVCVCCWVVVFVVSECVLWESGCVFVSSVVDDVVGSMDSIRFSPSPSISHLFVSFSPPPLSLPIHRPLFSSPPLQRLFSCLFIPVIFILSVPFLSTLLLHFSWLVCSRLFSLRS